MSVDPSYLTYPLRKEGMDHDLYAASFLPERKNIIWPGNRRVALWVVPILEFFPLDMKPEPINPTGGMRRPYPDYWFYTLADYGNRIGIYRMLETLKAHRVPCSIALNSGLAERYPQLVADCLEDNCEIIAHGRDMNAIHGDYLSETDERRLIAECRDTLSAITGAPPAGWYAPANALSSNTTRLVAEAGFDYTCDWVNDELPYAMTGDAEGLAAMPLGYELSDVRLLEEYRQRAEDYVEQVLDAYRFLSNEAEKSGTARVLALPLRPWIIGVPHRIKALDMLLGELSGQADVWCATGADILNAWKAQQ